MLYIIVLESLIVWLFVFACVFGLFKIVKKIYYNKNKRKFSFFNSIILIIVVAITKVLLISFVKSSNIRGFDAILAMIGMMVGICAYVLVLTILLRLIFKGIEVNYPVNNNLMIRLLKVLHIICLIADLTVIGAFFGIPMFLVLWLLQYVFAGEGNPFFAFRIYKPKSYTEEEIIDVEAEIEKPQKSFKTFFKIGKINVIDIRD